MNLSRIKLLLIVVVAAMVVLAQGTSARADLAVLSLNAVGDNGSGMAETETAGASGANVAYWNNMVESGTGAHSGSATNLKLSDGSTAALTTVNWSWGGHGGSGTDGEGSDGTMMFSSHWDPYSHAYTVDGIVDLTLTVTDIPFPTYDVYFYTRDAGAADRGGVVTANGEEVAIEMFSSFDGFPQYVQSSDPPPWSTSTTVGSYVLFTDLSGDLTLTTDAFNTPHPRLRTSGIQIVEVPEPGTLVLLSFGVVLLVGFVRRKRKVWPPRRTDR